MPGALSSREEFRKLGISILEISAPGKAVPRAHLSGITGRGEEMVHHLDVAVLRGRGVRNRGRIKSICREGDKGIRLESKTVEGVQVLFSEIQTVQEERPQTFMTDFLSLRWLDRRNFPSQAQFGGEARPVIKLNVRVWRSGGRRSQ